MGKLNKTSARDEGGPVRAVHCRRVLALRRHFPSSPGFFQRPAKVPIEFNGGKEGRKYEYQLLFVALIQEPPLVTENLAMVVGGLARQMQLKCFKSLVHEEHRFPI